jgi:phosphoserine phosphatase
VECAVSSRLEFACGRTTGRTIGIPAFGHHKRTAVQDWLFTQGIPPEAACFYSDSYTDIPLLEHCGGAVAVNPDRFLLREAKKRGWQVLRFD